MKKESTNNLYDWIGIIIVPLIAIVIIFTFFFRVVGVDGISMMNTLHDGDRVIISIITDPKPGDIVVISRNYDNDESAREQSGNTPIIKRVIAVGGQTVDIDDDGNVIVDGVKLDEPYIAEQQQRRTGDVEFPITIKPGYIFVMGDNRNVSKDSGFSSIGEMGQVNEKYVLGKAVVRFFPFSDMCVL